MNTAPLTFAFILNLESTKYLTEKNKSQKNMD